MNVTIKEALERADRLATKGNTFDAHILVHVATLMGAQEADIRGTLTPKNLESLAHFRVGGPQA